MAEERFYNQNCTNPFEVVLEFEKSVGQVSANRYDIDTNVCAENFPNGFVFFFFSSSHIHNTNVKATKQTIDSTIQSQNEVTSKIKTESTDKQGLWRRKKKKTVYHGGPANSNLFENCKS